MRRIAFLVAAAVLAVCAPAPARQSALAPDGTVYVTGAFAGLPTLAPFGPTPQVLGLLRTRLDGTRVNDFGRGGFVAGRWDHVAVLPGGGVAAVRFDAGTVAVTRMDANGATVESGTASVPMSILEDVRALSASQVLLSGLRQESGTSWRLVVAVLRTDGAFDSGFGQGGVAMSQGTIEHPSDGGAPTFSPHAGTFRSYGGAPAWVLADGRILVGGPQLVARFTPSGAPDTSWGGDGEVTVGGQQGIVAATGDGAFVLELPDASHVRVHRLRADGTRDPAFGSAGAVTHQIAADAGAAVKDARVLDDGRLGFLLWPAGAESPARAYELTPDGATLNAGAPSASTGYSDLFSVGQDLDAIGPELDHFALTRYGTALQRTAVDILDIVSTAPRVTIVDGPPTAPGSITGASAHFRIAVERRPEDLGFGSVRCEVNYRDIPCGSEATVLTKTEGEGWTLTAYGVSIHGAEGPPVTYSWIVNHEAPQTLLRTRPRALTPSTSARISFRTSEQARTTCAIDDGVGRLCRSPLHLHALRPGRHRVRITAVDTLGAQETVPATVAWRVGPLMTLRARRDGTVTAALTAPVRGTARVRATVVGGRRLRTVVLALRAGHTRVVRLPRARRGTRLRVAARLPGSRQPVVRTVDL